MIKINLLGDETVVDTSGIWLLLGYGLSVLAFFLVFTLLQVRANSSIESMTQEQKSLEKSLASLQETTKEVRELEAKKKELAEKTSIIAMLKKSKMGPVRVMDDLNLSIPEKAWVVDVKESQNLMNITGLALDNQTITTFMKNLEKSDFFETIELGESRKVDHKGISIKQFTLQAKVNYAGKSATKAAAEAVSRSKQG